MAFSCKIILSERPKLDKSRAVYLQAIIDRARALVPLGFYLKEEYFDARRQVVKSTHPNSKDFNTEFMAAIAKANTIASRFRMEERLLTPDEFRNEYQEPSSKLDVIKFIRSEVEMKKTEMAKNTYSTRNVLISKLEGFHKLHKKKLGPFIAFQQLTPDVVQQFKNYLAAIGNQPPTIHKQLKYLKQYLSTAEKKGIRFKDPFVVQKIRHFRSNKLALTQMEVDRLEKYFDSDHCPPSHRKLLRYFLFSCYTGLRISDVKRITWNNIHDDLLIFQPKKGEDNNPKEVTVPLGTKDWKFMPVPQKGNYKIFETFAEATSNRMLKVIAALDEVQIKKKVTYHTSRHTFGSLFAQG
ncbi:MAG TPA: phage integrase SAM-like domain-containing protein, partial [Ohtaekwangia sp.]|nr:phage integrase SAM-like domain-containing protein [Ohtaekwangia sp.]